MSVTSLPFHIEQRCSTMVLVDHSGGCRPATSQEVQMWDFIMNHQPNKTLNKKLFPCGNCGFGLDLDYLQPGQNCPNCGCEL